MRIAVMESIVGSGGHEVEHDRLIIEELQALGHEVALYVPEGYQFKLDYNIPVYYLPGKGVSYVGASGLKKIWLSAKREVNRLSWYRHLYQLAQQDKFDAIIFPTATYRFFRSLNHSVLRKSPVPVIFCVIGVTPEEGPYFFNEVEKLEKHKNIKVTVVSLLEHVLGRRPPNVHCIKPAIYTARDFELLPSIKADSTSLKIGFFGQYRLEKKIEEFLEVFTTCRFSKDVELVLQTVAIKPDDINALNIIKEQYRNHPHITFFDRAVYGKEWQEVISGLDAIVIPYAATRFRYHGSGMLLTAIGMYKPIVISDEVWPELLTSYEIGVTYKTNDKQELGRALQKFVDTYSSKAGTYIEELRRVNEDFSPRRFATDLVKIANGR